MAHAHLPPMGKRALAEHVHAEHPEMVYPHEVRDLLRWPFDQLRRLHDELHDPAPARA